MSLVQTPVHVIGGQGGSAFTYYAAPSGKVLTKIGVWAGGWFLGAIRVWFTNENPRTYGTTTEGPYREFTFADGERMTSLSLWGNGAGTRAGGIRFRTSQGREFYHHMTSWGLKQEYPIDVASGICVGITGRHGWHIDSVGFMFLLPIASARMLDLRYPTLDLETAGIVPVTLDSYTDSNNATQLSKNWSFSGSRAVTISSSWSLASGIEVHATLSVQAGIPTVAEVSGEFGWAVSVTGTYTDSYEESRTLSWNQSGVLEPGQWILIKATTRRGTVNVPYEATMQITLRTGTVFSYPLSGMYAGVDYSSVDIINSGTYIAPTDEETAVEVKESVDVEDGAQGEVNEAIQELRESNLGF